MPELRFRRRRRGTEHADEIQYPSDPLAEMAQQIRELDAVAAQVASRISAAAGQLNTESGGTRAELTVGIASALVDRTDEIRTDCERLSNLLQRATEGVARLEAAAGTSTPPPPVTRDLRPVSPGGAEAASARGDEQAAFESDQRSWDDPPVPTRSGSDGSSECVRLIATQMAIAGSSRSEIERRLRIQFGVVDAGRALDDIFGTGRSGAQ